jgi:hypothetical protein
VSYEKQQVAGFGNAGSRDDNARFGVGDSGDLGEYFVDLLFFA